jgi:hypothetical protein
MSGQNFSKYMPQQPILGMNGAVNSYNVVGIGRTKSRSNKSQLKVSQPENVYSNQRSQTGINDSHTVKQQKSKAMQYSAGSRGGILEKNGSSQ